MNYWWRLPARRMRGAALIVTAGLALIPGLACRVASPAESTRPNLRIATAFGPLTQPLAAEYRHTLTNIDVQSVAAPNSIDVIHAILSGTAGQCRSEAYRGGVNSNSAFI